MLCELISNLSVISSPLKICLKFVSISARNCSSSNSSLGWISSAPGDFHVASRSSCSLTNCSVFSRVSLISEAIAISATFHPPRGLCVITDEKKLLGVQLFSPSFVVNEPSSFIRAGIAFTSTVFCRT